MEAADDPTQPTDPASLAAGVPGVVAPDEQSIPSAAQLRRSMWRFVGTTVVVTFFLAIIGGFLFKTDYVALIPGSTRDTEALLSVDGTDVYPSEGEIHYTTVRLVQNPSLWEYLWFTAFDDDAELVRQEVVLGDQTVEEARQRNLQLMTSSKDLASAVALEVLGYHTIVENGVIVTQVLSGTAADGIIVVGDIIVSIDGASVLEAGEAVDLIGARSPGDELTLVLDDGTEERTVTVVLGAKEDDPEAPFLGIAPASLLAPTEETVGFDIEIDSESVGGPSAGLAFTLGILDDLTPGELTGGETVAVTGTIEVNGSVGPVGGVEQKAAAVRDAGIGFFIVPSALGEETIAAVREAAGDGVEVIPVANIDEALAALGSLGGDVGVLEEYAVGAAD